MQLEAARNEAEAPLLTSERLFDQSLQHVRAPTPPAQVPQQQSSPPPHIGSGSAPSTAGTCRNAQLEPPECLPMTVSGLFEAPFKFSEASKYSSPLAA